MTVRRLFQWAQIPSLVLAIVAIGACGGESADAGCEDQMRPILFQQAQLSADVDAVLDPIFEEITTVGDLLPATISFASQRQIIQEYHDGFIEIESSWESLEPPAKAEAFHQRTLEMISLRVSSTRNLVSAAEGAVTTGQLDTSLLLDAGRKWGAALEMWSEVLAEANTFNAGDQGD
jgi:hypothetical protein